jgi:hypothetical protein
MALRRAGGMMARVAMHRERWRVTRVRVWIVAPPNSDWHKRGFKETVCGGSRGPTS